MKDRTNWDAVAEDVASINWRNIFQATNPIASLNSELVHIINRRVPQKTIQTRMKDKAWFNDSCRRANEVKQHAYHQWARNKSRDLWNDYIRLRSNAITIYATAQEENYIHLRVSLGNVTQPHKWWSTLKASLFGVDSALPPLRRADGDLEFHPGQKAEILSSTFMNKQSDWSPCLPASCHPQPGITGLAFRSADIFKNLIDLNAHGGVDPNGIFPLFLKKLARVFAPKLSKLFRILLSSGSFPKEWRCANITPIPKGNSCTQFPSDYRPISITPVLSKLYERLLSRKLDRYVESNNLLPATQFGFRRGLGTCDALLTLVHDLQSGLDSRSEARVVSLDFSSAFDLVNHSALLFKLESIGVGGNFLKVIREFLSDRRQCVSVDGHLSESLQVISGVPQGSVLGPLLFILYTADLCLGLEDKLISYADDTTLYAMVPSPDVRARVADSMNRDLHKIQLWCEQWGMKLNPSKTQSIVVSRSRTTFPLHPDLSVCDHIIPVAPYLKLLGITLDDKLTFERHIRTLSSSLAQKGGILRKCFKTFRDIDIVRKSFFAFVLPCFEYCSPVWMSAAPSNLRLLERILRSMSFIVPNLNLNLDSRREVSGLSTLFKIFKNHEHPMNVKLPDSFVPGRFTRFSASLNRYSFQSVRHNTNQFSRCFLPYSCRLWNQLPDSVVEVDGIIKFKAALKQIK